MGRFRLGACKQILQVRSQIFYYLHSPQLICQLQILVGNNVKQKDLKKTKKGKKEGFCIQMAAKLWEVVLWKINLSTNC